MSESVKISVVIPVYNAQDYLHQTLDSLIHQTLREIEIICVDDGSTDRSLEILNEYAAKDSRVRVLTQKNQYAGAARNAGMKIATGEYVHFLDADDYMKLDAYEVLYSKAVRLNAEVVKAKAYCVDGESGEVLPSKRYALTGVPEKLLEKPISFPEHPDLFRKINIVPWNGIYKLDFLRAHSIQFNRLFCVNDRSFFKEILLYAQRIIVIPEYVAYHRVNLQTSLVGQRAKHFECHFESYEIIEKLGSALPERLQAIYMNPEMQDVVGWWHAFRNSENRDEILPQVYSFLQSKDITPILKHCREIPWLETWIELAEGILSTPGYIESPERNASMQAQLKLAKRRWKLHTSIPACALRKAKLILKSPAR